MKEHSSFDDGIDDRQFAMIADEVIDMQIGRILRGIEEAREDKAYSIWIEAFSAAAILIAFMGRTIFESSWISAETTDILLYCIIAGLLISIVISGYLRRMVYKFMANEFEMVEILNRRRLHFKYDATYQAAVYPLIREPFMLIDLLMSEAMLEDKFSTDLLEHINSSHRLSSGFKWLLRIHMAMVAAIFTCLILLWLPI